MWKKNKQAKRKINRTPTSIRGKNSVKKGRNRVENTLHCHCVFRCDWNEYLVEFYFSFTHLFGRLVGRSDVYSFTRHLSSHSPCAQSKCLFLIYSTAKRKIVYTKRRRGRKKWKAHRVNMCSFPIFRRLRLHSCVLSFALCIFKYQVYLGLPFDNSVTQFPVNLSSRKGKKYDE